MKTGDKLGTNWGCNRPQGAARRRITTHLELANIKKALQTQSFCIEDGIIGTLTIPTQVPPRGVEPLSLD